MEVEEEEEQIAKTKTGDRNRETETMIPPIPAHTKGTYLTLTYMYKPYLFQNLRYMDIKLVR